MSTENCEISQSAEVTGPELLPCPFCGQIPKWMMGQRAAIMTIVCPEGSSCRGSGLLQACRPEQMRSAAETYNRRATSFATRA
jgi:hypothetical protein